MAVISSQIALAYAMARLCIEAGAVILSVARAGVQVSAKVDGSPVSEADVRAEGVILNGLAQLLPGVPVVAEESVCAGRVPQLSGDFLLVDPLDGTREFLAGRAEYTVNIALVRDGRPLIGALHAPALGETFAGVVGEGAWVARQGGEAFAPIHTRAYPAEPVALISRSHNDAETEAFLAREGIVRREAVGSSLKFARIADGVADLYPRFGPTMEWDTAAGDALLTAAGGCVVDLDGAPLRYGKAAAGFRNGPFMAWSACSAKA